MAYIAGRLASGSQAGAVYDYSEGAYFNFSGDVGTGNVNVFDYEQGCHISGSLQSLFHYGNGRHIQLTVEGGHFSGFDYNSGRHFNGNVQGNNISLFDYEHGQYFNYSV